MAPHSVYYVKSLSCTTCFWRWSWMHCGKTEVLM